jgi:alpha-glucosidase
MRHRLLFVCLLPFVLRCALAQDERRVLSPDGSLEFRILVTPPEPGALACLAYQVWLRGQPLIHTSFLGLNIHDQEPMLGAKVGLTSSRTASEPGRYNSLVAEYMQDGSLGRRINVEVRVWNDGVAFRYVIPNSTPLGKILIEEEFTEFEFAHDGAVPHNAARSATPLTALDKRSVFALPFLVQQPGAGWVAISESPTGAYPHTNLVRTSATRMVTRLVAPDNSVAFEGITPMTCPWRAIFIGPDRDRLLASVIARDWNP